MMLTPMNAATILSANDHWDGPGAWWPIFPILWFIFVVSVVFFFCRGGARGRWRSGTHAGESRLSERYAAGEIDETEYRARLAVLREKRR